MAATITKEDALNEARDVLRKARRSSVPILVVISGKAPYSTRSTVELIAKWMAPGMPFVGLYNENCPVGDIADDILHAMVF